MDGPEQALQAPQLVPLAEQYDEAVRLVEECNKGRSSAAIERALSALSRCDLAVERAALFSSNEDADDISTASLKYLLIPSMRAELLSAAPCSGGPEQRLQHVTAALSSISDFLTRAVQYGIVKGTAAAAAGVSSRDDEGEEASAAVRRVPTAAALDPGARRIAKIERFQRTRVLQAAAEQLRQQREEARRKGRAGAGADDAAEGAESSGAAQTGGPGGWDEEDERRLRMLQLEGAALSAIDTRDALLQESQLLAHAAAASAQQQPSATNRSDSGRGTSTSCGTGAGGDARMWPGARRVGAGGSGSGAGACAGGEAEARAAMMVRLSGIADKLTLNDRDRLRQQVGRGEERGSLGADQAGFGQT